MGYAVKQSGECRAVYDKSCCTDGEKFTTVQPVITAPTPDIDALRRVAYADPINGSDRYLSEALSIVAGGGDWSDAEVKLLQSKALEVKEQIKAAYPKTEDK